MPRAKILDMARELLELLGLSDAGKKLPNDLSGGMKKRVSLAEPSSPIPRWSSLMSRPQVWIPS